MSRTATIAVILAFAIPGFALQAIGGFTLSAIGFVLIGIAGVLAIAAVFYAIGASEDREREGK